MFAWIVSAACIAYIAATLLLPECVQMHADAALAMLTCPPLIT